VRICIKSRVKVTGLLWSGLAVVNEIAAYDLIELSID
jgi:hypothetical protein